MDLVHAAAALQKFSGTDLTVTLLENRSGC